MVLIPVSHSKSVEALSCVSVIAQTLDKVYLSSRLPNALWNCYFLSKLLFQSLYYLKVFTYTLSQELLFQRMQFFRTAIFQQLISWSFKIFKYPAGGSQSDALVKKSFH